MIYDFDKFSSGDFIIFPNNDLWPRRAVRAEHRIKNMKIIHVNGTNASGQLAEIFAG